MLKKILVAAAVVAAVAVAAGGYMVFRIGPRNVIGLLRYDQREEGALQVGDKAPDVMLLSLDGTTPMRLGSLIGEKPLVLIFGSFT